MKSNLACRAILTVLVTLLMLSDRNFPIVAGEFSMKSGFRVEPGILRAYPTIQLSAGGPGNNVDLSPFYMLDDGMRRYFVGQRQVVQPNFNVDLSPFEKFDVHQRRTGGSLAVESVGPFRKDSHFDNHGHRLVSLVGPNQRQIDLSLGITQLRPQSCTVTGLNCQWEFSVATSSLKREVLQELLKNCIDLERPEDRFAVFRFYQQAGFYDLALTELEAIANDLPSQKPLAEERALEARQLLAKRLLLELKHRRAAGQHRLTAEALKSFPTEKIGGDILRELRQFQTEFDEAEEKIARIKIRLGDLQEGLTREQAEQVAPLRDEVTQHISLETLPRLEPFLRLEKDDTLKPAERLALAYSGWVVGDANAVTDLANAVRWWQARFHVLQYLRAAHPVQRQQILADLQGTEGVGAKTVEQLIPNLPPIVETPGLQSGQLIKLTVFDPSRSREEADPDEPAIRYSVLVPQEFNPQHVYPVVISLHEGGLSPERELRWWGGDESSPLQSQRHGYLVVSPEYLPPKPGDPLPAPTHTIVSEVLRDVRRRFLVDSDRVYLSGHGRGAEAAFEVAFVRPDQFAGILPISGGFLTPPGGSVRDTAKLRENARGQAWYMVMGEFDFGLFDRHASWIESLMLSGTDVLVTQYKARGHESYYSEIHRLFDWMETHRRAAEPKEFKLQGLRGHDVRIHWARWSNSNAKPARAANAGQAPKAAGPISLEARILPGETEIKKISVNGTAPITIWLNAKLIDLDKRLIVELKGQPKFNDFLKPEIESVLEDFRQTGDRQRLHSVRVLIP